MDAYSLDASFVVTGGKRLLNTTKSERYFWLFVLFFLTSLFKNNMVGAHSFYNYGICVVLLCECTHKLTKRTQIGEIKIDNAERAKNKIAKLHRSHGKMID